MRIRRWTTWFPALTLVALLAPSVALAQEADGDASQAAPILSVLSMLWEQLGFRHQPGSIGEASPIDLGSTISEEGVYGGGTDGDMGPSISPDGVTAEGTSNDMGPSISPDG